ncbi:ABC transporter ATP-binding protein [candidate division KSB1 bacterium]
MKLQVCDISFYYNRTPVLKGISLDIAAGEFAAIIGPNGSGKTTLIRCIDGILRPAAGSVLIDERDIRTLSDRERARKIAYVPQSEERRFPIRVFCSVLMGRKPCFSWAPGKDDLHKTAETIDFLGLSEVSKRDINQLSGGQRQKVDIARALVLEPEILLLDEPTTNLDFRHQLEILDVLKHLSGKGVTVIMAIHDLSLAGRYADRVVILDRGAVFASGGTEIITPEHIERVYGVKVSIINNHDGFFVIPRKRANGNDD